MNPPPPSAGPPADGTAPTLRRITVERVASLAPRTVRVTFRGDDLADLDQPRPGGHVKLVFIDASQPWPQAQPLIQLEPRIRTYTPRYFDRDRCEVAIDFVLHGRGLGTHWVSRASRGSTLALTGPDGGYEPGTDLDQLVIIADESAMAAAGTIIEAAPDGCRITAVCEVRSRDEERPLSDIVAVTPTWVHRMGHPARAGATLLDAVRSLPRSLDSARWWIACESAAMRSIRDHLLDERDISIESVHTDGYWEDDGKRPADPGRPESAT
ncbi:MAG: siderophore-interacting protein [Myxococcota bacterium]